MEEWRKKNGDFESYNNNLKNGNIIACIAFIDFRYFIVDDIVCTFVMTVWNADTTLILLLDSNKWLNFILREFYNVRFPKIISALNLKKKLLFTQFVIYWKLIAKYLSIHTTENTFFLVKLNWVFVWINPKDAENPKKLYN